ncbi:hypothetical protein F4808DRAFT_418511 [Astrocystis sublimbata]|nr:hypothetical protein F4808DRAFT_418511 [Astrocystis sublimbata]
MASTFDVTPEQYASQLHWLKRQLFETPPAVTKHDANLAGKTAIITGANQGIGLEISRQLLGLGLQKLILGVRDENKGQAAARELEAEKSLPSGAIEVWKLDMLDHMSVANFARRADTLDRLDLVSLNAGILRIDRHVSPTNKHEEDIQTNYLSTALLAILFLPILKSKNTASTPGKLTITMSDSANQTKFVEQDKSPLLPAFDDEAAAWDMMERYGTSKLLGQLFLMELARRVPPTVAIVNGACPGLCHSSGLGRDAQGTMLQYPLAVYFHLLGRSPGIGARVVTQAAAKWKEESHGQVIDSGRIRPMALFVYTRKGEQARQRLWEETMEELEFAKVRDIIASFGK